MFVPIGDSPNPPGTPWVNYALIGINVLVFVLLFPLGTRAPDPSDPAFRDYVVTLAQERGLTRVQVQQLAAQVSEYDLVVYEHGFKPAAPSVVDALTSMFLHGGLLHLLGNMLFLWIYGDNVEHRLGRFGYLLAYLGTGGAAIVGDGLLRWGSAIPSVGASGAISGVLGLYFLWFPHNRVRVWVFLFPLFANVLELPARLVLGIYIVLQNVLPWLFGGEGGVAHGAHIGGFAGGWLLALALNRLGEERSEAGVRRWAAPTEAGPPAAVVGDLLDRGAWQDAAAWFFQQPHPRTRAEVGPWEKLRLGDELRSHGQPRAALAAYQRALGDHPRGPARAAAHLGAARVLLEGMRNPTAAYQHLYAALEEDPSPEEEAEARGLLAAIRRGVRSVPTHLPH